MQIYTENKLTEWPLPFIESYSLQQLLHKEKSAYYSFVTRAMQKGSLARIRQGLYRIDNRMVNLFELAQELHGPSFISFESALNYHGWIPEAVYTTTSSCMKRSLEIQTPLGLFEFRAVPTMDFFLGVERVDKGAIFLLAAPWRAIADLIHANKKIGPV